MDLDKFSNCPSYQLLVEAHTAYLRAFAIKAQEMPRMHSKFEKLVAHCERELAYIEGRAEEVPAAPELEEKPKIVVPEELKGVVKRFKAKTVDPVPVVDRFDLNKKAREAAAAKPPKDLPIGLKMMKPKDNEPEPPKPKPEPKADPVKPIVRKPKKAKKGKQS